MKDIVYYFGDYSDNLSICMGHIKKIVPLGSYLWDIYFDDINSAPVAIGSPGTGIVFENGERYIVDNDRSFNIKAVEVYLHNREISKVLEKL